MSAENVLVVENVSKKFCRNLKKGMIYALVDLFKGAFSFNLKRESVRDNEFWALKDVSFTLKKGQALALLGINGSGKTTLLRLIAGLMPVDHGVIKVKGRVASLIAIGAGFHPHMSARENIFLNGAILGMSKEFLNKNFDDIVDFAEIRDFLDAPVSTFSSGMRVRLGFAIATASKPDLLLLDEILAVGDSRFRQKCYNRIATIMDECALVFVSHNMTHVSQLCSEVLLLKKGDVVFYGDVETGVEEYDKMNQYESDGYVQVNEPVIFQDIKVQNTELEFNDTLEIDLKVNFSRPLVDPQLRVQIIDMNNAVVAEWNSLRLEDELTYLNDLKISRLIKIENLKLRAGTYYLSILINEKVIGVPLWYCKAEKITVKGSSRGSCAYQLA